MVVDRNENSKAVANVARSPPVARDEHGDNGSNDDGSASSRFCSVAVR